MVINEKLVKNLECFLVLQGAKNIESAIDEKGASICFDGENGHSITLALENWD